MRKWVRSFVADVRWWHRGLPDPDGRERRVGPAMREAMRRTIPMYWSGLRSFYGAPFRRNPPPATGTEAQRLEAESTRAARLAARAVRSSADNMPAVIRRWVTPRLAVLSEALIEFGRGYREG